MAIAEYQCWLYDAYGVRLDPIPTDRIVKLSYTRSVNTFGTLTLVVARNPAGDDQLDRALDAAITADTRLEVWRKPVGGTWAREGDTPWLIQKHARGLSQREGRYRRIVAYSALHLLSRRIVAAAPGTDGGTKQGAADDLMKEFVDEAIGGSAGTFTWSGGSASRSWGSSITTQAGVGVGTTVDKDGGRRNLLTVCQELASDAMKNDGIGIYFDIVYSSTGALEFRTYVTARGADRTSGAARLVISPERGSLGGTVEVETDWSQMATAVYAGGQGQEPNRPVGTWGDAAAIGSSTWGLREVWLNASHIGRLPVGHPDAANGGYSTAPLDAEAGSEIDRRRPLKKLSGTLMSIPGTEYGVNWFFGDLIVAEFERESFEALIDSVTITVTGGGESAESGRRPAPSITNPATGRLGADPPFRAPYPYGPGPEPLPTPQPVTGPIEDVYGRIIGRSTG